MYHEGKGWKLNTLIWPFQIQPFVLFCLFLIKTKFQKLGSPIVQEMVYSWGITQKEM